MQTSPFKFLDSYTKEDKDIFFGREQEIEELYTKIFRSRLLLVYGLSGTGKSSLIQCGLGNKFNDSDWLPISIRRSGDMITSMWNGLCKHSLTPLKELKGQITSAQFKKGIQSLYLDHFKPVYLIFDQFEELFIFGSEEERKQFVDLVAAAISSDIPCKFIFVIREEYLANLTGFEYDLPELFSNRIRIEKMSRLKAKEVIEKPCKVFGIEVEETFAENLLNKISPEKNEIELTYLQVYLDKLYKIAEKLRKPGETQIRFTNKMLDDTGSITDLLGSFLEEQIAQLPKPDHALTLLKSFVSTQGTKRQINLEEIRNNARTLGKDLEEKEITNLVTRFTDLRILRDKDESGRYELRHDALAAKIYEKITLVEKDLLEIKQFIENAHINYRKRFVLLSKDDLKYIAPYEVNLFLSENLKIFVNQSKKHITAKQRKKRNLIIACTSAVFLLIATGITYVFYKQKKEAEQLEFILSNSSVIASADRMNVLYIGVDNPMTISVPGIPCNDLKPMLSDGEIIPADACGKYMIRVKKPGEVFFTAEAMINGAIKKIGNPVKYRVKFIPDPKPAVGNVIGGGEISKEDLLQAKGIYPAILNFAFDVNFSIVSFDLTTNIGSNLYAIRNDKNGEFTPDMKFLIKQTKPFQDIYIDQIKILGPDGIIRDLDPLIIKIK